MIKNFGLPYMGSKNKIAKWVLEQMPSADNFYDLFCGGCSITHCAIVQEKYKNYVINDISSDMPNAFVKAIYGGFKDEDRWISHEEFDELKGKGDVYVDTCFSFGSNWKKGYAYSRKIEPQKKAAHYAIFFKDYSLMDKIGIDVSSINKLQSKRERHLALNNIVQKQFDNFNLESFVRLERLQNMEMLQAKDSLFSMERKNTLNSIKAYNTSYENIDIRPNSVIYCDIPYKGTGTYSKNPFDYDKFYEWALSQKEPIFISEYLMPDSFICINQIERTSSMSATNNSLKAIEKIFIPKK